MKHPVIERPEYTLFVEEAWFGPILHQDVHVRWSPIVKRTLLSDLRWLGSRPGELHVAIPEGNAKLEKFVRSLGCFAYHCIRINGDGDRFRFYRRLP